MLDAENEKQNLETSKEVVEKAKPTDEEVQAWLDGVHYGSCCADDPEDCQES